MSDNRFAQLRDNFEKEPPKRRVPTPRTTAAQKRLLRAIIRKGVIHFRCIMMSVMRSLKSLSHSMELSQLQIIWKKVIVQEWEKMQRKLKNQER